MNSSVNTTVLELQDEISLKQQQLKQEKAAHFEILDKFTRLQDQMDIVQSDLKHARKSRADITYRSTNRIEQLEQNVIDLNAQIKEEREKVEKSKAVIMSLRNENREFEDELSKLHSKMEEQHKQSLQAKEASILRMSEVVAILEDKQRRDTVQNQQMDDMKKKNEDITEQLTALAMNAAENKHKWKEKEEKYEDDIMRLNGLLKDEKLQNKILNEENEAAMHSKMDTVSSINVQIDKLRQVIKSQQRRLECLQNKGMFDGMWNWS